MSHRLAILGATGLVGRTMLAIVEERLPGPNPPLLLSRQPVRDFPWRGSVLESVAATPEALNGIDVALFATEADISREWATIASEAGVRVVDNSSAFRYEDGVPLVVPEVNGALLDAEPMLVANPNCSTIGVVMALAPLTPLAPLVHVSVATYQSISGAGRDALDRFEAETRRGLDDARTLKGGSLPLGFNVLPRIDRFESNGYTREEMKVVWETRKILGMPGLAVSPTAVRVPVRVGHCAAVTARFEHAITVDEARAAWNGFPGVTVLDDPAADVFPTALAAEGIDDVLVGRARTDVADPSALSFFVASDNLRKGAALNAVQIVERLIGARAGTG